MAVAFYYYCISANPVANNSAVFSTGSFGTILRGHWWPQFGRIWPHPFYRYVSTGLSAGDERIPMGLYSHTAQQRVFAIKLFANYFLFAWKNRKNTHELATNVNRAFRAGKCTTRMSYTDRWADNGCTAEVYVHRRMHINRQSPLQLPVLDNTDCAIGNLHICTYIYISFSFLVHSREINMVASVDLCDNLTSREKRCLSNNLPTQTSFKNFHRLPLLGSLTKPITAGMRHGDHLWARSSVWPKV